MRGELHFGLGQIEFENRLLALQNALLRSGGSRRTVLAREEETVQRFGIEMFGALFHDHCRDSSAVMAASIRMPNRASP